MTRSIPKQIPTAVRTGSESRGPRCRFCGTRLDRTFVDLGMSPLCETYPTSGEWRRGEIYYPLHVYVCEACLLVQLESYESPESIFSDYPYFSSYSDSWLAHAESYCGQMTRRLGLDSSKLVVEIASNDGYLLQYFRNLGIPVLGIDPAANVAEVAIKRGIPTRVEFFGRTLADQLVREGYSADLIVANNVLAQVPDLNDFVGGLRTMLKPGGVVTIEVPHLLRLIESNEFDTIYHEHFSYFSLLATMQILEAHGLQVFDVEELHSHGGSLRIYGRRADSPSSVAPGVQSVLSDERAAGLDSIRGYEGFGERARATKFDFLGCLLDLAQQGKRVAGYGAPGKSATLLHYCGIGVDLIEYVVDRNPAKQGRCLPGTHIPIFEPERLRATRPDYIVILPWNLRNEISEQLQYVREWGARLVVPIPRLEVY